MANPASIQHKRDQQNCILDCRESDPTASLAMLQDYASWVTLLQAANIRKSKPIQDMAIGLAEGEVPHVQYYRKCRSLFTMKKTLKSLLSKEQSTSQSRIVTSLNLTQSSHILCCACNTHTISCTRLAVIRLPEAPTGCPTAMAPPFTFVFSRSRPRTFCTDKNCAANASFT